MTKTDQTFISRKNQIHVVGMVRLAFLLLVFSACPLGFVSAKPAPEVGHGNVRGALYAETRYKLVAKYGM